MFAPPFAELITLTLFAATPEQRIEPIEREGPSAEAIRFVEGADPHLAIALGDRIVLRSPPEGLWSIGIGWKDGWPATWHHAHPTSHAIEHGWLVLTGTIALPEGELLLRDAYRVDDDATAGVIVGRRRFEWRGAKPVDRCTLSVRWLAEGAADARPFLPGISFYGNPSGARMSGITPDLPQPTPKAAVPVQFGRPGERSLYEEHRYPMPFAAIESKDFGAALHTLPSLVPNAHRRDQWWSLGLVTDERGAELSLLSGPCASNGLHAHAKATQGAFLPYDETWMTLRPGTIVEKEFALETFRVDAPGHGFRTPLRTALRRAAPCVSEGLPTMRSIIESKLRFAASRYRERPDGRCGFEMYPDWVDGTQFVMGWCGQAETMPFVLLAMADAWPWPGGRAAALDAARRSLDHLASAPFTEHGFLQRSDAETGAWADQDHVSQGQALDTIALAIEEARRLGIDASRWEDFLRRACELHARRVREPEWRPISTNEAFLVSPLLRAARLLDAPEFADAGLRIATTAAERHIGLDEPYWGGTLDARCEDKEGAWAAFQAFLACFDRTGERIWLERAEHAMDAVLSWTVLWDIDLPPGRLRDHGFRSRGWTMVSAQNQHLDVYGVLYTPELVRMGRLLDRPELVDLAIMMFRSCGQLIDHRGSQGEQIQQTNFAQQGDMSDVERMRGGYSEGWTVFWITTHFLHAAARLERMGISTMDDAEEGSPPR